jgi:hypothetical protein
LRIDIIGPDQVNAEANACSADDEACLNTEEWRSATTILKKSSKEMLTQGRGSGRTTSSTAATEVAAGESLTSWIVPQGQPGWARLSSSSSATGNFAL